jgi:hypothetical protein
MIRTLLLAVLLALAPASAATAQEPDPAKKPAQSEQAAPRPGPQPINVRIDITLTEEGEDAAPSKTVTLLLADMAQGRARSASTGVLNVDARPEVLRDGRVRVTLSLEYRPDDAAPRLQQSLTTVLASGKPMVVSQSADPKGTRRVRAELTATILK